MSYQECMRKGVFTTQFDGMRLCTTQCQPGYINVSSECRENQPKWCKTEDNQLKCEAPSPGKYYENDEETTSCTSKVYDDVTRECLESVEDCHFYMLTGQGFACVRECETGLSYNGQCV